MKEQYIRPTIYAIEIERLMDDEITGGGGSIKPNPNTAKGYDIPFDNSFFADNIEESEDEFGGTLKKAIEKAHYSVWEDEDF